MHDIIEQGTAEWFALRLGKVTASRIADVTARTKTGYGAGRANYMAELLVERLTGQPAEKYVNGAMQWGTENEPAARAHYEMLTGDRVDQCGFIPHPSIEMAGASPDGLVGDAGLVEIKCPNTATHIDALLGEGIDGKYIKQMQWQMACSGRQWCDFVTYDPRLPFPLQMKVTRVTRDSAAIDDITKEVIAFLAELGAQHEKLNQIINQKE